MTMHHDIVGIYLTDYVRYPNTNQTTMS